MKICSHCRAKNRNTADVCCECNNSRFYFVCAKCGTQFKNGDCPKCGLKGGRSRRVCPKCGNIYYDRLCPKCGYDASAGKKSMHSCLKKKKTKNIGIFILLGVLLVAGIGLAITWPDAEEREDINLLSHKILNEDGGLSSHGEAVFCQIAEKTVKSYLKAPSTAKFEHYNMKWSVQEENVYLITGPYEAENAFGVPIQEEYIIVFEYNDTEEDYALLQVALGDELVLNKKD